MGPGQNCTNTKLHGGTKLHEDKIARRVKFAQRRFCTKTNLHEVTNLHEGTKLHKDKIALRVNFARATNLHGESNLHGCQICTGGGSNLHGLGLRIRVKKNRLGLGLKKKIPCKIVTRAKVTLRAKVSPCKIVCSCKSVFVQI